MSKDIVLNNIVKKFSSHVAVDDFSANISSGELIAIIGPSGSGKTTLLRIIAGLEKSDAGAVFIGNQESNKIKDKNSVSFVFQNYALFKNMTVFENVAFGLRVRKGKKKLSNDNIIKRVNELLKLVRIYNLNNHYPSQISGGQQQRVAFARALAINPSILLLDEPFGALDLKTRRDLRYLLREIHEKLNITTIFVTHDQDEAMELADRIIVINNGRIEQLGTPEEIYNNPTNFFVYDFMSSYNSFDAWKDEKGSYHINIDKDLDTSLNKKIKLYSRPHEVSISIDRKDKFEISCSIIHINPIGHTYLIEVKDENRNIFQVSISYETFNKYKFKISQNVWIRPNKVREF